MKKILIVFVMITSMPILGIGQIDSTRRNSLYVEVGGIGVLGSINYDYGFKIKNNIGLRLGIGFCPRLDYGKNTVLLEFPINATVFYQIKKHTFELGTGLCPFVFNNTKSIEGSKLHSPGIGVFGQMGYRYSIFNDKFYLGASFTPMFYDRDYKFMPYGGIKFGYKF